jgi:hypothetical protein
MLTDALRYGSGDPLRTTRITGGCAAAVQVIMAASRTILFISLIDGWRLSPVQLAAL